MRNSELKFKVLVRGQVVRWYLIKLEHTPIPARLLEKWGNNTSVIGKGENEWFGSQEGKVFTLTSWSRSESPWLREAGTSKS